MHHKSLNRINTELDTWHQYAKRLLQAPLLLVLYLEQEVKVIWQKAPHGAIPRLGVTPGGRNLHHWIPGVGFPISVP